MESFNRMLLLMGFGFALIVVAMLYGMSSTAFIGVGENELAKLQRSVNGKRERVEIMRNSVAVIEAKIEKLEEASEIQTDLQARVEVLEAKRDEYKKLIQEQRDARTEIIAEYGRKHRAQRNRLVGTEVDEIKLKDQSNLQNVKFVKFDDDRVSLQWPEGLKGVSYEDLPGEWREKTGYDKELDELLRVQENRDEEEAVIVASDQNRRINRRGSATSPHPRDRKKVMNPMDSARISRLERTNVLLEQRIIAARAHIRDLDDWIRASYSRPRGKISARGAVVTRKQNQITSLRNWIANAKASIVANKQEIEELRN